MLTAVKSCIAKRCQRRLGGVRVVLDESNEVRWGHADGADISTGWLPLLGYHTPPVIGNLALVLHTVSQSRGGIHRTLFERNQHACRKARGMFTSETFPRSPVPGSRKARHAIVQTAVSEAQGVSCTGEPAGSLHILWWVWDVRW